MAEIDDLRREIRQIGDLMLATTSVVEELVRITHGSHPDQIETYLRRQRLTVQEATTDRSVLENDRTLQTHRQELRLLERALRRDAAHDPSGPA